MRTRRRTAPNSGVIFSSRILRSTQRPKRDLVIQSVERDAAHHQMQIAGGAQVANQVVGDAVGQLFVAGRIAEQADDHADDGIHRLAP